MKSLQSELYKTDEYNCLSTYLQKRKKKKRSPFSTGLICTRGFNFQFLFAIFLFLNDYFYRKAR